MPILEREEYVEQAYLFRTLAERTRLSLSTQEVLVLVKDEILSTTKLPLAIDYLASDLKLKGVFAPAMTQLSHYFTPFQIFIVGEAENERAKFDFHTAMEILWKEAVYRAEGATPQGVFLYQFEVLCRNRLGYDQGLAAVSGDPIFNPDWKEWILTVRRQIGLVDFADLIYVRSDYYQRQRARREGRELPAERPMLFREKEGKIAFANRQKDPLFLFSALSRQLGYPGVPRHQPQEDPRQILPSLSRRVERLENRVKLLEEEQKGGIDLTKFYGEKPQIGGDAEST